MPNALSRARPERVRELLILLGFVLLVAVAIVTVLLPETQNQQEPGEAGASGAREPRT